MISSATKVTKSDVVAALSIGSPLLIGTDEASAPAWLVSPSMSLTVGRLRAAAVAGAPAFFVGAWRLCPRLSLSDRRSATGKSVMQSERVRPLAAREFATPVPQSRQL